MKMKGRIASITIGNAYYGRFCSPSADKETEKQVTAQQNEGETKRQVQMKRQNNER